MLKGDGTEGKETGEPDNTGFFDSNRIARIDTMQKAVKAAISWSVPAEDHDKFVALVLEEFANLHEGNAIRFGVRPLEFAACQEKIK